MKKCIVNVIFKDGQVMPLQVERFHSISFTEYNAFDGLEAIEHKIYEIRFVRDI
jgi:hypothetical protein